jgi:hypothetical protein
MLKQFLVACLLGLALALPAQATSVLPLSLDEIIDTAAVAFQGTCTGNRTERETQTNLVVTCTAFAVKDVLKGTVQATHVIRQIGSVPGEAMRFNIRGVPKFTVGIGSIGGCAAQAVNSGHASCITSALTLGRHNITAVYPGKAGALGS